MPRMPPWPSKRITSSPPFSYTGLDYLGPLYVKNNGVISKVWICLFTCLAVRAIHLELVESLSAADFLHAIRRFISRRGKPVEIISDNATQFKLSKNILEKLWDQLKTDKDVQSYISSQGINWKFIVQLAPWMGGFYERLVGLVKFTLRKILFKGSLSTQGLTTIITECESVLNSRPLVYVGEDISDGLSLTPSHFLMMNTSNGMPILAKDLDPEFLQKMSLEKNLLEKWKESQNYLTRLWKVWSDQYMLSLRERYQSSMRNMGKLGKQFPSKGDIVLLKDNLPRGTWKLGQIVDLPVSKDGQVRSAKVQLPSKKTLNRPMNLLIPLECASPPDDPVPNPKQHPEDRKRDPRGAAVKAKERIQEWMKEDDDS